VRFGTKLLTNTNQTIQKLSKGITVNYLAQPMSHMSGSRHFSKQNIS